MEPLTGLDASFLYLETPEAPLHVSTLMVCDPSTAPVPVTYEALQRFMEQKARTTPVFRKRLVEVPLRLYYPVWIDDPNFDIIHHVRHAVVPQPGDEKALGQLVGRLTHGTMDRRYPLWEVWLIEGLKDGRIAILGKMHHALVDGVTGAGMMVSLFDMQPRPVPDELPPKPKGDPIPTEAELLAYAGRELAKQPRKFAKVLRQSIENYMHLLDRRERFDDDLASVERGVARSVPATHFNRRVGPKRNLAFARLSLNDVKAVKKATGTTVNDVVLAVCGGALRNWLARKDDLPDEPLIASCPVSVHGKRKNARGSNQVSALRCTLATHIADPLERLREINKETLRAKEELDAIGADLLAEWAEVVSPHAFNLGVRLYSSTAMSENVLAHNVIISNVPGPRFPLYLAGAQIEAIYPIGPIFAGCGLNITLFSYRDNIDFGFFTDPDLCPDIWDLADEVQTAFADLQRAAGIDDKPSTAPAKRTTKSASKKKATATRRAGGRQKTAKTSATARAAKAPVTSAVKQKETASGASASKTAKKTSSRLGADPLAGLKRTSD
ncbi:MAG: wax ester/triacylglycerol synthase family O-acyltransferase [Candidatus Dadabacteria bacterium]|nr:MAG: wax ester/triacylglycerol synthase family O-acyltransferase [Candidatus Dadabacteria bacterium]